MGTPLGHTLLGLGLTVALTRALRIRQSIGLWTGTVVASGLPDLDLLLVRGGRQIDDVHRKATHSLLTLGGLLLVAGLGWRHLRGEAPPSESLAWGAALLAHPLLDTATTRLESGAAIPLLWPLARRLWGVERPIYRSPGMDVYQRLPDNWRSFMPELRTIGGVAACLIALGEVVRLVTGPGLKPSRASREASPAWPRARGRQIEVGSAVGP